ncbi:MAG: hypothetical protein HDR37_06505 [Treponema sp.]|nr:hypothetical protein [Treponema sp.]
MKKTLVVANIFIVLLLFSSCAIHPHYVCEYVSDEKLYLKSLENKLDDFVFEKYTVNENVFVFKPEATLCYCDSKTEAKCRFLFTVYSKRESYKYHIDNICLILDGKEHDVYEYQIDYYPYDRETYTNFTKGSKKSDYYWSNFHLGYFSFPTPQSKQIEFKITVSDLDFNQYTFSYKYFIKFTFDLFISKV